MVGRELITLSDATAALKLGLVPPPAPGADACSHHARRAHLPPARTGRSESLSAAGAAGRGRRRAARGDPRPRRHARGVARRHWREAGLSEEQLRLRLRDDLRIEAFLAQRFGSTRQPSDQELQDYYRVHQADYTTAGGRAAVRGGTRRDPGTGDRAPACGVDQRLAGRVAPQDRDRRPLRRRAVVRRTRAVRHARMAALPVRDLAGSRTPWRAWGC